MLFLFNRYIAERSSLKDRIEEVESISRNEIDALKESNIREIDKLRAVIVDLERKLHPSGRDRSNYAKLMDLLPWNRGFIPYIRDVFNAKQWIEGDLDVLSNLIADWEKVFFDDGEVQEAFVVFYNSCREVDLWCIGEGAPTRRTELGKSVYTIAGAGEREGGWEEFDAIRRVAFDLIRKMISAFENFEKAGREKGL